MKYYFPQDKILTTDIINKFIELDRGENARKIKLHEYYKGQHNILRRAYEDASKPNNKVVNPYANYITTLMTGYFIGEPVQYTSPDEAVLEQYKDIMAFND
jgi:SPP1 family phage portal protein